MRAVLFLLWQAVLLALMMRKISELGLSFILHTMECIMAPSLSRGQQRGLCLCAVLQDPTSSARRSRAAS